MARPQTKTHVLVENAACLDLYRMIRAGDVKLGCRDLNVIGIKRRRYPEPWAGMMLIAYDLCRPDRGWLHLYYTVNGSDQDQAIRLEAVPRESFGGQRWWFVCPQTGKRAARLFLPAGQHHFLSREAHGLRYAVEHISDRDKPIEQVFRLYQAISRERPPLGAFSPCPERPKGMHRERYWRFRWRYMQAQRAVLDEAERKLDRWRST